jgi:hypothetical protein
VLAWVPPRLTLGSPNAAVLLTDLADEEAMQSHTHGWAGLAVACNTRIFASLNQSGGEIALGLLKGSHAKEEKISESRAECPHMSW